MYTHSNNKTYKTTNVSEIANTSTNTRNARVPDVESQYGAWRRVSVAAAAAGEDR